MPDNPATRVVTYQLVKAATSVGATAEEAVGAESKRDFVHKMIIARKEARESRYPVCIIQASIEKSDKWAIIQEEGEKFANRISNGRKTQAKYRFSS
jgi:four helix bundle protein